jgi:hypothetical protein
MADLRERINNLLKNVESNQRPMRFQEGGMAEMSQEEGMAEMSQEEGMAEIQMSKEQAMQEIFMPLVEAGFEAEVMAILNNPVDSEISRQAVERLLQVLSQEPDFDMDDFMMAVLLVAPQ